MRLPPFVERDIIRGLRVNYELSRGRASLEALARAILNGPLGLGYVSETSALERARA